MNKRRWINVLLLSTLTMMLPASLLFAQAPVSADRGKLFYNGHCASCHGLNGDGNGPEGVTLTPKPTNFKNALAMSGLTDPDLERAILIGKERTAMRGYATVLQPQDVRDLIAYLRSLSK